jgi:hypothetical protein
VLSHFDSQCPQKFCWKFCSLMPNIISGIVSALCSKRYKPALFLQEPMQPIGIDVAFLHACTLALICSNMKTQSRSFIIATRYRSGNIAPSGHPVRSRTVEDAIRAADQNFSSMGGHDIRKTQTGDIDVRIQRQFKCWGKEEDPPARVNPISFQIILPIFSVAFSENPPKATKLWQT